MSFSKQWEGMFEDILPETSIPSGAVLKAIVSEIPDCKLLAPVVGNSSPTKEGVSYTSLCVLFNCDLIVD